MRYIIDHDFHIHSHLSTCSEDPEQTPSAILEYAKENKLNRICLTDHYWDSAVGGASAWYAPQNFEHISASLPLPRDPSVDFLFGCETDMDKSMRIGIPIERFDDFNFVIIPTTHMHMGGFTIEREDKGNTERCAALWCERLEHLFSMPLPFEKIGIAHLATKLINPTARQERSRTLDLIEQEKLEKLFATAAQLGCGIEINSDDMAFSDAEADSILRIFKTAKHQGCKFYLGSDAHDRAALKNAKAIFERAVDLLCLEESDKYQLAYKK